MTDTPNTLEDLIKKMPKEEKDSKLFKLLQQEEKARKRSKDAAIAKKEAGMKQFSAYLPEQDINKFKELMKKTRLNKTEFLQKLIQVYERSLQQQQQNQQQTQQQNPQNQQRR